MVGEKGGNFCFVLFFPLGVKNKFMKSKIGKIVCSSSCAEDWAL